MRIERTDEDIKYYLSKIIQEELKDPKLNYIITITSVETTKDLRYAKVYVSIFGTKYTRQAFEELLKAKGYIKKRLGQVLKTRMIPDLEFKLDDSMEYGSRMDKLIDSLDIKKQNDEE